MSVLPKKNPKNVLQQKTVKLNEKMQVIINFAVKQNESLAPFLYSIFFVIHVTCAARKQIRKSVKGRKESSKIYYAKMCL